MYFLCSATTMVDFKSPCGLMVKCWSGEEMHSRDQNSLRRELDIKSFLLEVVSREESELNELQVGGYESYR